MPDNPLDPERLLARLQVLEDERAIMALLQSFNRAADDGPESLWLGHFAGDESVLEIEASEAMLEKFMPRSPEVLASGAIRFAGIDALRRFIGGRRIVPGRQVRHHTTFPLVQLSGDRATADSYWLATAHDEGRQLIEGMGRYIDTLTRTDDGQWRIVHRTIRCQQN